MQYFYIVPLSWVALFLLCLFGLGLGAMNSLGTILPRVMVVATIILIVVAVARGASLWMGVSDKGKSGGFCAVLGNLIYTIPVIISFVFIYTMLPNAAGYSLSSLGGQLDFILQTGLLLGMDLLYGSIAWETVDLKNFSVAHYDKDDFEGGSYLKGALGGAFAGTIGVLFIGLGLWAQLLLLLWNVFWGILGGIGSIFSAFGM